MPEPRLIQREREVVRNLLAAIATRHQRETELLTWYQTRKTQIEAESREERERIERQAREETEGLRATMEQAQRAIPARMVERIGQVEAKRDQAKKALQAEARKAREVADEEANRARWEATTLFEADRGDIDAELDTRRKRLAAVDEALAALRQDGESFLAQHRMTRIGQTVLPASTGEELQEAPSDDPVQAVEEATIAVEDLFAAMERLRLPKLFRDANLLIVYLLLGIALVVPFAMMGDPVRGGVVGAILAVMLGTVAAFGLYRVARSQVGRIYPRLADGLVRAESYAQRVREWAEAAAASRHEEAKRRNIAEVRKAERRLAGILTDLETDLNAETERADREAREAIGTIREAHEKELETILHGAGERIAKADARRVEALRERDRLDEANRGDLQRNAERSWDELRESWRAAVASWSDESAAIVAECERLFLDWESDESRITSWEPPRGRAPATRFGAFTVDPAALPKGPPRDERLREWTPPRVDLPALAPLPEGSGALILRAYGDGRDPALELVRAIMLRLLTSIEPGKVRFTIVDPVGLGQNFAGFMHLADYDEALVGSRIWTEEQHIESKLVDLTEHMEKVIQKYLRNEFETIQQYNVHAGEVAEPYRVLVIANFPANINEGAARRLVSICQSGPRCGVYPILMIDEREALPPGLAMADLEKDATILAWREGRFAWKDADFGGYPLRLDRPPSETTLTRLLRVVGERAKEASRVEVPFEIVVPPTESYWTGDSRKGVEIPLGRVGANKLQFLRLGVGTAQHVLIAGRTGSGKSTLLHALIVSAALRYSPEQLELYLIDFKKGVEFKTYAGHHLPHARVVAIESEREFGLSVLQRLDVEMKERGDTFRALGVQDLAGYREAAPPGGAPLPRILLVVDEFQEFFVDDDKVAQEAALLLDRLVRQGRAFGIHVLLGSQSLGGAFALARSTMGQMAVRIALQCSESDAHLILNEENTAARLLSRPGEAIYNDSNGAIEGNNFFQVVWLADSRRDDYLERVNELDRLRNGKVARPQIVFEGQVSADLEANSALEGLLTGSPPVEEPRAPLAWLGDPVAIKPPTATTFRRQSGANVLIVGQNPEAAMGLCLAASASLIAQHPPRSTELPSDASPRLIFLDGSPDDAPFARLPGRLLGGLPGVEVLDWREAGQAVARLASELKSRQEAAAYEAPSVYLFVYNLSRIRDLRKSDDDFGFSRRDAGESPASQFSEILREGPAYGVHTVTWCDSWNNLQRMLDRQALREFEHRVLFQMSPNDSSNLIDSPTGGKLGPHRALYVCEDEGIAEKFRPYGLPDVAWWERLIRAPRLRRDADVAAASEP